MTEKQSNAIVSVIIAEKVLGIENSLEVVFKDYHYFEDYKVSAIFIKEGYTIVFNNVFLNIAETL